MKSRGIAAANQQQQRRVRRHAQGSDVYTFFNLLTGPELFDQVEALLPAHREQLFPPTETLSMFLSQALSADRSCQKAVDEAAVRRSVAGLPLCSTHTGGYCNARARLPQEMMETLTRHIGCEVTVRTPAGWRWCGRPVRLVDGTTLTLPDTAANQAEYPQPRSQKPGLGFPLCHVLGLVCLDSGVVLNAAVGRIKGKGGDEQTLLRGMLDTLERGDVLLGDAYFATYFLLCSLRERGIDDVFEQYGARKRSTDFRRGGKLGIKDPVIVLSKPTKRPDWMTQAHYDAAPATLAVGISSWTCATSRAPWAWSD